MNTHVVIVGYGMAGARLAEEIRARDPHGAAVRITIIGAERHLAYNRVLLPHIVEGELSRADAALHGAGWARENRVELLLGTTVRAVDRAANRVLLDDGRAVGYDRLVLATGSTPWLPPIEGLRDGAGLAEGVAVLHDLDDCLRIAAVAERGEPVAVLGGGVLGLESARALAERGTQVTVVHRSDRLMDRQLDGPAGAVLADALTDAGVGVLLGCHVRRYRPRTGLELANGAVVPARLVVVATGVRPAVGLASAAGIAVEHGVVVDDLLRTDDPAVHAIGDCAQHDGVSSGLVGPAWEQASVLADLLTGADSAARYRGSAPVTALKARGIDLVALGETHTEPSDPVAEVLRVADPARRRYAKLVVRNERVAGAIMIGFPGAAATIAQLYGTPNAVPAEPLELLAGANAPASGPVLHRQASSVICRCNTVTKGELVTAWQAGARSVDALSEATRAGSGCGGCRDTICALADALVRAEPAAVPVTAEWADIASHEGVAA